MLVLQGGTYYEGFAGFFLLKLSLNRTDINNSCFKMLSDHLPPQQSAILAQILIFSSPTTDELGIESHY